MTNLYNFKEKGERREEKGKRGKVKGEKNIKNDFYELILRAIASAALIPSTAEETMPPA
jgi:hypothetical protein